MSRASIAGVQRGAEMKPPPGFEKTVRLSGRDVRIRYVTTIRDDAKHGRQPLDGFVSDDSGEVWVRRRGVCHDALRSAILHEVLHWGLMWARRTHGADLLPVEVEEQVVCKLEESLDAFLADNRWFRELYDGASHG